MNPLSPFSQNDYEVTNRDLLYDGVFRLVRYHIKQRLFNGGLSDVYLREILERKSAAAVLPYNPHTDEVILIEQFRAGAIANPQSPWLIEIVAGIYDINENPVDVAIREAKEEAGCLVSDLHPIHDFFVSPGGSNEQLHLFIGRIDINTEGIHGLADEHEDIRAFSVPRHDAYQYLQEGKIKTSPAIIALQWLQLNHEWLKQLWLTK
jgi:ADP-ribose pyrophosphatase